MVGALRAPSVCPQCFAGDAAAPRPPDPRCELRSRRTMRTVELRARLLMTKRVAADHSGYAATMFTSFGGRTTTRLISFPASARVTPGAVIAMSRSWASVMSGETSSRSRTFPFT
jgi:hypothetical protein